MQTPFKGAIFDVDGVLVVASLDEVDATALAGRRLPTLKG